MIIGIQGTNRFDDYSVFLRGMGNALREMKDGNDSFTVFSAGPLSINQFAQEFLNVSERSLKARGIKVKLVKVPPSWFNTADNLAIIEYFLFFSKPKEKLSSLVDLADAKDIPVGVYRF